MGKFLGWILTTGIAVSLLTAVAATVYAQSTDSSGYLPNGITTTDTDAVKAKLQAQLDDLEKQIAQQQAILDQTKGQDASLSNEIKKLNAQITQTQLEIKARDLAMQQLSGNISQKQQSILGLNTQLGGELESLAAILREKYQLDKTSLVEAALADGTLSDFFSDIDTFDQVN